jgi:hypothetical protein
MPYYAVLTPEVLRKKERGEIKLSVYDQNWWEKLVWVPVISLCKISFPDKHLMAYYAVLTPLIA